MIHTHLAASADRALGAVFFWCPTTASAAVTPRVLEAQFGDGYVQRRPAGINTQDQEWTLEFANRRKEEADAIVLFLAARNGVDIFNWTPPRMSVALNVICPEWSLAFGELLSDRSRLMTVNARFVEQHA